LDRGKARAPRVLVEAALSQVELVSCRNGRGKTGNRIRTPANRQTRSDGLPSRHFPSTARKPSFLGAAQKNSPVL